VQCAEASKEARQLQREPGAGAGAPAYAGCQAWRRRTRVWGPTCLHRVAAPFRAFGEGRKWKQLHAGMASSRGNATGACIGGAGVSKQLAGFATWASCEGYKETRRNR
jgi:hypothetical protein